MTIVGWLGGRWSRGFRRVSGSGRRAAVLGVGLTCVAGALCLRPGGGPMNASHDLPFLFQPSRAPTNVIVIAMDEEWREPGEVERTGIWSRARHTELLRYLTAAGARAVVFDVFFRDADPRYDDALAEAMRQHGTVIIGSHLHQVKDTAVDLNYGIQGPCAVLGAAARTNGVLEVKGSACETVRRFWPGRADFSESYATLSWAAATVLRPELAQVGRQPPRRWLLNYYGPPRTFTVVSYKDATNRPPSFYRGAVILVGKMLGVSPPGGAADVFRSPYPESLDFGVFDGVEIHATMLANLLQGEWLREVHPLVSLLAVLLVGGGAGWGLTCFKPVPAACVALVAAIAWSVLGIALPLVVRWWFPWLIAVAVQLPVALAWVTLVDSVRSYGENRALRRSLAGYLSPGVVTYVLENPAAVKPGGSKQPVSILASDLASFSRISERMDAARVMGMLNEYYAHAVRFVHETDGTVLNLVGDGMFAIWNAPLAQADHPARALQAALALRDWVDRFSASVGSLPLRVRVGLNVGEACVGNVGGQEYFNYTAIGREVNLASRLEGLNKRTGTRILATRAFVDQVGTGMTHRDVGWFHLAGIDQAVEVHEILGPAAEASGSASWREVFAVGLHHFRRAGSDREGLDKAAAAFQQVLTMRPEDGPAEFYRRVIAGLRQTGLPSGWLGEVEVIEK